MASTPFHILITRPLHQAQELCTAIKRFGWKVTLFPTIEIQSIPASQWKERLDHAKKEADLFIFLSVNAVFPVLPYLNNNIKTLLAIGPATRKALIDSGFTVQSIPNPFSSEGLLSLPELNSVFNKKILIFSGKNSRPYLSEILRKRGAQITQLEVYQRVCPNINTHPFLESWEKNINIVVSSSEEGLKNWSILLGETGQKKFKEKPLIVISHSMKKTALNLKLGNPILLAHDATDSAILEVLENWSQHEK